MVRLIRYGLSEHIHKLLQFRCSCNCHLSISWNIILDRRIEGLLQLDQEIFLSKIRITAVMQILLVILNRSMLSIWEVHLSCQNILQRRRLKTPPLRDIQVLSERQDRQSILDCSSAQVRLSTFLEIQN